MLDININKNLLTISVEKETETVEGEKYTRREFSYTKFTRSFRLPKTVESENIAGAYKNGILNVTLPKKEEAKELEESLKAYLGLFKQTKVMGSQGGNSHYASILKDRIVEVVIENDRKTKQIQIILRSTSRFHGPRMETEQLVSLVRQEASLMN